MKQHEQPRQDALFDRDDMKLFLIICAYVVFYPIVAFWTGLFADERARAPINDYIGLYGDYDEWCFSNGTRLCFCASFPFLVLLPLGIILVSMFVRVVLWAYRAWFAPVENELSVYREIIA